MLCELYTLIVMTKRLQVLFEEDEYRALQRAARDERMTVAEWVRQTLRQARLGRRRSVDRKLQALTQACRHEFPTADIDIMLEEIEKGYPSR